MNALRCSSAKRTSGDTGFGGTRDMTKVPANAVPFINTKVFDFRYGDTSSGRVAVPLWIPQTPVAVGLALLTLALVHTLVEVLGGAHLPQGEGNAGE